MPDKIIDIEDNIKRITNEIEEVADKANRNPSEIILVGVTKYSEIDDIKIAYEAGLNNLGENRIQNALPKIEQLPKDITWHMIGHLQRNKVKLALGNFSLIHAVESERLAEEINKRAIVLDIVQEILLEVNISGEYSKFGLNESNINELVEKIQDLPNIYLKGLMTMAPFVGEDKVIRETFSGLRNLRDRLEDEFDIELPELSMGMTNDYKIAIEEGATILRIGSAIFK